MTSLSVFVLNAPTRYSLRVKRTGWDCPGMFSLPIAKQSVPCQAIRRQTQQINHGFSCVAFWRRCFLRLCAPAQKFHGFSRVVRTLNIRHR